MPDRAAMEALLRRLRLLPVPEMPVPADLGPLSTETSALNFEPVPPRFTEPGPIDTGFVSQYAGAAPTPPAPLSRAQRVVNAIGGFGASVTGQLPQYLESLREPQRRYERRAEQYDQRRTAGIELAERRAEREAERANRMAELAYTRDYNLYLKKLGIHQDEANERTRQAFELFKLDRQAKIEERREAERERQQKEADAKRIEERYFSVTRNRALSRELGQYWGRLKESLSPAAARLDRQVQGIGEARMRRGAGIGGGGAGEGGAVQRTVDEFNVLKQIAIQNVKAAGGSVAEEVEAVRKATAPVVRRMARQPHLYDVGVGAAGYMYAQPRGGSPAPAPAGSQRSDLRRFGIVPEQGMFFDLSGKGQQPQGPGEAEIQEYARTYGVTPEVARKELMEMKRQ